MHQARPVSLTRRAALLTGAAGLALAIGGLTAMPRRAEAADPVMLTLYSAQHHQMVDLLIQSFTKQTGIKVRVHSGEAPEIANQIAQEGAQSPADVYFTENSPELTLLDEKGLLAKIDAGDPGADPGPIQRGGRQLGGRAGAGERARVQPLDDPGSPVAGFADGSCRARHGKAKSRSRRVTRISCRWSDAVVVLKGRPAALAWLKGLKVNAQVFDDDEGVVAAVDRGSVATGIINNYYWARLRAEQGADKMHSQIHHFANGDVGALVNVSGAAVLKSSKYPDAAQQFVAFLVSKPVQTMLGAGDIDFEYPLAPGVRAQSVAEAVRSSCSRPPSAWRSWVTIRLRHNCCETPA